MAPTGHRVFGSKPISRYVQLADIIRQRIAKEYWPPGTTLRSIKQLPAEFEVFADRSRSHLAVGGGELASSQRGRGALVIGDAAAPDRCVSTHARPLTAAGQPELRL
jgi:GntR family transcriptional regulator